MIVISAWFGIWTEMVASELDDIVYSMIFIARYTYCDPYQPVNHECAAMRTRVHCRCGFCHHLVSIWVTIMGRVPLYCTWEVRTYVERMGTKFVAKFSVCRILCVICCDWLVRCIWWRLLNFPRLELYVALLLSRLIDVIIPALRLNISWRYLWTDSTFTLAWITAKSSKWKTFVANCVGEIHTFTDRAEWGHVTSNDNPADVLSRGCMPSELKYNTQWHCPSWLEPGKQNV